MNKFLESGNLQKLTQDEKENINSRISINETEHNQKTFLRKLQNQNGSTGKFSQTQGRKHQSYTTLSEKGTICN